MYRQASASVQILEVTKEPKYYTFSYDCDLECLRNIIWRLQVISAQVGFSYQTVFPTGLFFFLIPMSAPLECDEADSWKLIMTRNTINS